MNDTPAISLPGPTNCRLCSEVSLRNNVHSLGLSFDSNHLDSSAVSDSESLILVLRSSITFDSNHAVRLITSLQSSSNLDELSPDNPGNWLPVEGYPVKPENRKQIYFYF